MFDRLNQDSRFIWPHDSWKQRGGKNKWGRWRLKKDMEGVVVHYWAPRHRDVSRRSFNDRTIILVHIGERFVPMSDLAVEPISWCANKGEVRADFEAEEAEASSKKDT